jgi:membrane associated rhomboid family serine protease
MKGTRRERWHRLGMDLRGARVSWAAVLILCGVQVMMSRAGQPDWIYESFGLSRQGVMGGGLWQLLTHALLHGPWGIYWWHLVLNAACLLVAGARVERIGGGAVFLKTFFAGVISGGIVQLLMTPDASQILIGASGGLFAVMFWLLTVHSSERMWPLPLKGSNLAIGLLLAEAGILITAWFLPESGLAAIGSGCHLGGAIAGWCFGRKSLGPRLTKEELRRERERLEAQRDRSA